MQDSDFRAGVLTYVEGFGKCFKVVEIAELAPGVIGVHDSYQNVVAGGEWDICFDSDRWNVDNHVLCDWVSGGTIGIVEGRNCSCPPESFVALANFGKRVLHGPDVWYEVATPLEVPVSVRVVAG